MKRGIINKMLGGLWVAVCILGLLLVSFGRVMAENDTVIDEVNVTVSESCTLEGVGMDSHVAELHNVQYSGDVAAYENGIGKTTLTAFCNDYNGFSIYAIGFTGDTVLGENHTKLVGVNTGETFSTAVYSDGDTDSSWAMKLTKVTDGSVAWVPANMNIVGDFDDWHVVPDAYAKVAEYHANTGSSATDTVLGGKLETTYAAFASASQLADTYEGKVKYTLVHPYNGAAPEMPVACNPEGTTIGTDSSTDVVCMQDITSTNKSTLLASMTEGTQYSLVDKRDEKDYKIAKLADGKVWMTQNLDLDIDSSKTYTNEDTDLGWNTSTNQYDTASWTPSRSTYATTANNIHEWCVGGTWNTQISHCEQNNTPESYDPGDLYWNTMTSDYSDWNAYYHSCNYSTGTPSCDETLNPLSTYTSSTGTQQYHLGNYYNWPAAIASNDDSIYGAYNETTGQYDNLETHQSICPAGWTLPYVNYNNNTNQLEGDFVDLWTEYGWDSKSYSFTDGISTVWSAPLYFTPAGGFMGSFGGVGLGGGLWSSVVLEGSDAHDAGFYVDGGAYPANDNVRFGGESVRCLLR